MVIRLILALEVTHNNKYMRSLNENIETIITELTDSEIKLSDILYRVRAVGNQLRNEDLLDWVDNQVHGFPEDAKDVPSHRVIVTVVKAYIFDGHDHEIVNVEIRNESNVEITISSSIQTMEIVLSNPSVHKDFFKYPLMFSDYKNVVLPEYFEGCPIIDVYMDIPTYEIESILKSVRNVLIDFMFELGDELGLELYPKIKTDNKAISALVQKELLDKGEGMNSQTNHFHISNGANSQQISSKGDDNQFHSGSGDNSKN
jgi:hypothetical protein